MRMGVGPCPAKIMLVGEAYGEYEERQGEPFVGASGQELNRMLHEAGIMRSECYVTNLVNARPPMNDIGAWIAAKKKDITFEHTPLRDKMVKPIIQLGYASLLKEIELIQPNVIVALGNASLWALTGAWGISKWRGSLLRQDGNSNLPKVIPVYHPAYIIRDWSSRAITVNDLKKVKREMLSSQYNHEPKWQFRLRPSFLAVLEILQELKTRLDTGEHLWIDLDLETRAGHIACCGLSWSLQDAISIPFMCVENSSGYWSEAEEPLVVYAIYQVACHPNVKIRWQNGLYDAQYTYRHWHFVPRGAQDTMISHHTAFAGLPKRLDFQSSMYCNHHVYWKDDGKTWSKDTGEDQLWSYNCVDCVRTREVGEVEARNIQALDLQPVEDFQQALFWPVLQAMQRGIRVDVRRRNLFAMELQEEMSKREEFFREILGHPLNPRSPKQMAELFYGDFLQRPVMTRAKKGNPSHATCDDDALQTIVQREPLLKPLVKAIQEYRSLGVFLSTFVLAKLDVDGRLRCSFNICGTETYRFSSSENAFGSGCVPGNAEVLTKDGWVRIDSIRPGIQIAQYDKGDITFEACSPFKTEYQGDWYIGKGEQFDVKYTDGHRVPYLTKYLDWSGCAPAALVSTKSNIAIPLSGRLRNGIITFSYPRLLVSVLADGSYEGNLVRISFKKKRKIERFIHLADTYGIDYWENSTKPEYRRFVFRRPADWPSEKKWGTWVYNLEENCAETMIEESKYWDAHIRGESFMFLSADKFQADLVATLAHLTGRAATIRRMEQSKESWSDTTMWFVNIKPRNYARIDKKHWSKESYAGDVYCVTVPSSYFLMRYNEKICITGNTNFQNIPKGSEEDGLSLPNVRKIFVPDPGFTFFDMDLDRADLQVVVWEADDAELKEALRLGVDMHLLNAYTLSGKDLPPLEELVEGHPRYMDWRIPYKKERQLAKSFIHGTNYGGGARTMAIAAGVTVHQADRFQKIYFGRYPGIKHWHDRTFDQLTKHHFVSNAFGYRRYYFDRTDGLLPEALAWQPQSTVACVINRAWANIYENLPEVQVLLQVHDSLAGQFPTHLTSRLLPQIRAQSLITIPYDDPLIIPVGIKTNDESWGGCV
ncbi:MAG: hypothetical protein KGL39_09830 [Patescibacteria group bacterium]|nr:hypothetical protein [Patescibacteria group bacterium]